MIGKILQSVLGVITSGKQTKARSAVRQAANNVEAANRVGTRGDVARAYNNLGQAQAALDRADMIAGRVTGMMDTIDQLSMGLIPNQKFCHTVSVSVKGGPEASLRRCWFLCISALFGRRRRGIDAFWAEAFNAQWNITGKEVTATLAYTSSTVTDPWTAAIDTQNPFAFLQRGPDQVTIGGSWATSYLMVNQNLNAAGILTGGIFPNRVVGGKVGKVIPGLVDTPRALPGQLADPMMLRKFSKSPGAIRYLPLYTEPRVDPDQLAVGWVVRKQDADAIQPVLNAYFQPWTARQVTHALAEMPIGNVDLTTSPQLLPYRCHAPLPFAGYRFVERGGMLGVVPKLPDENRVITTGEKLDIRVQPPKPPVDGVSRGHLLTMIAAALADPGVLVEAPRNPDNNTQPLGAEGLYVAPVGTEYSSPEDRYRIQPVSVVGLVRNVFDAFQNQTRYGQYTKPTVDNIMGHPGQGELRP